MCGGGGEGMVIKLGVGILKERHFVMHAVLSNFGIIKVYIDVPLIKIYFSCVGIS